MAFEPGHAKQSQKREKMKNEIGITEKQGFDQVALQNNFYSIFWNVCSAADFGGASI
jgi:hypothetical protein